MRRRNRGPVLFLTFCLTHQGTRNASWWEPSEPLLELGHHFLTEQFHGPHYLGVLHGSECHAGAEIPDAVLVL